MAIAQDSQLQSAITETKVFLSYLFFTIYTRLYMNNIFSLRNHTLTSYSTLYLFITSFFRCYFTSDIGNFIYFFHKMGIFSEYQNLCFTSVNLDFLILNEFMLSHMNDMLSIHVNNV